MLTNKVNPFIQYYKNSIDICMIFKA